MATDENNYMRDLIVLTDAYSRMNAAGIADEPLNEMSNQINQNQNQNNVLLEDLRNLSFKLRAHSEQDDGDISLGVEMGMERAAEMIEHLLNRRFGGV